jgi:hypothetical protein
MKKEKLIEELQKFPNGIEVCLYDWRKNLCYESGDGSGAGIYPKFEVEKLGKKDIVEGCKPFVTLSFENDDYNDAGDLVILGGSK